MRREELQVRAESQDKSTKSRTSKNCQKSQKQKNKKTNKKTKCLGGLEHQNIHLPQKAMFAHPFAKEGDSQLSGSQHRVEKLPSRWL